MARNHSLTALLAFFLLSALPISVVHADTETALTSAQIACIGTAVHSREASMGTAVGTYFDALKTSYASRATALDAAYGKTILDELKNAENLARLSFSSSVLDAFAVMKRAQLSAETAYATSRHTCITGETNTNTGDDDGGGSGDDPGDIGDAGDTGGTASTTPPVASTTPIVIFSDDFHRADANSTGNGWTDDVFASCPYPNGISNNRQFTTGCINGATYVYRTDIATTSGIAIKGEFSSIIFSDGYELVGTRAAGSYHDRGYYVYFDGQTNEVKIADESGVLASAPFSFNNVDRFGYEWQISASPQNWSYLYVWNASTGSRTSSPTLSWTNNGANFSPRTSGNRFYVFSGLQGLSGPEVLYQYLYSVTSL